MVHFRQALFIDISPGKMGFTHLLRLYYFSIIDRESV